jgi:hypothetical protein
MNMKMKNGNLLRKIIFENYTATDLAHLSQLVLNKKILKNTIKERYNINCYTKIYKEFSNDFLTTCMLGYDHYRIITGGSDGKLRVLNKNTLEVELVVNAYANEKVTSMLLTGVEYS